MFPLKQPFIVRLEMKYVLDKTIVAGQVAMIANYGDSLWEWLTNEIPCGECFDTAIAIKAPCLHYLATRTKTDIVRVVLANVTREYAENPAECPIQRIANHWLMK
jgi:hypothetical protein